MVSNYFVAASMWPNGLRTRLVYGRFGVLKAECIAFQCRL